MARPRLILAIDQGTTNTKALLIDASGAIQARASYPVSIAFPEPGWVEQDAYALWTSVLEAAGECITRASAAEVSAIAITNQRESAVVWDRRTGKPAAPCIVWQCRRTTEFCERIRAEGLEPLIRERSGLPVDPLFSASKIRWILDHIPDGVARAAAGELCAGTVDSWLLWNLTGGSVHRTDASNASRTQLLNLRNLVWDADLLKLFGVPAACLPDVRPSSGIFGHTVGTGSLPPGTPIAGVIGDSHGALFGHAAFAPGAVKATYGTGSSLMTLMDLPLASQNGLSTTVAWAACGAVRYALEGNITNTGGTVQWVAELLGLPGGAEGIAALASAVPDSAGAYLVPAFAGLGAPHWDASARGLICGLTRGISPAHIARAALDSIAYQVNDVFQALCEDLAISHAELFADGGASRNDSLMQFQADILGCPVVRSASTDLSAIGAAWLAGLATGVWKSQMELEALPRETSRFEPRMLQSRRADLIAGWRDAVGRTSRALG